MPLDPSIYNQSGRVNLGAGLSDILDQQRQRDAMNEQRQNTLASLAMQQQAAQQKQAKIGSQDLNMMLSNRVQSGEPIETVMQWAVEEGNRLGVPAEVTQKHVTNVYAQTTPQARSDVAFTQAYPELVAKQRAESMFSKPASQAAPSNVGKLIQEREALPPNDPRRSMYDAAIRKETERAPQAEKLVAVFGAGGNPVLVPASQAAGMQPFSPQTAKVEAADKQKEAMNEQASLSAQQVLDQANKLLTHPGRQMATGASSFMSKVPGTEARGFAANLDTFKAQTFLPMVSALKGMGALSDAEGKKIADSVGALDPSMPEGEFEQSLKDTMKFLNDKAKAAGLNVVNPLEPAQAAGQPRH